MENEIQNDIQTDNNLNKLSTLFDINNYINDNQQLNNKFELYLQEKREKYLTIELPEAEDNKSENNINEENEIRDNNDKSEELNHVRTRQPYRKYKDFYQYYGENTNKEQESYTSDEAYALANKIKHHNMIKEHNKGNSYA